MLQEGRTYAEENGLFFVETSAKTAINVNDIFYEIGENVNSPFAILRIRILSFVNLQIFLKLWRCTFVG